MARISTVDAHEFRMVKDLCYAGLDSVSLRERVGERLSRHLGAPSYCFGASDPATGLPVHSVSVGLRPDAMEHFYRLLLATPTLDFAPWAARGQRAERAATLVEDFAHDPYLTDILAPAGLRHDVQVACVSGGRSWGHLCLRRTAARGDFAGHELRLLDALAPHLAAGLRAAASRAARTATPGAGIGVVVIGPDGTIELVNGVAERLFSRPLAGSRHSLVTAINITATKLEQTLGDAAPATVPSLTFTDEARGEVYRLRAERLTGADGRPRGLVLIEPATTGAVDDVDALLQLGLSRREAEVTLAVVRGQSTAAIAAELVVSPHTVTDHLRKVYEKLGVTSRQQLAARLMGGG